MSSASNAKIVELRVQAKRGITNGRKTSSTATIAIKRETRRCSVRYANDCGKTMLVIKQAKVRIYLNRVVLSHGLNVDSAKCESILIAIECSAIKN